MAVLDERLNNLLEKAERLKNTVEKANEINKVDELINKINSIKLGGSIDNRGLSNLYKDYDNIEKIIKPVINIEPQIEINKKAVENDLDKEIKEVENILKNNSALSSHLFIDDKNMRPFLESIKFYKSLKEGLETSGGGYQGFGDALAYTTNHYEYMLDSFEVYKKNANVQSFDNVSKHFLIDEINGDTRIDKHVIDADGFESFKSDLSMVEDLKKHSNIDVKIPSVLSRYWGIEEQIKSTTDEIKKQEQAVKGVNKAEEVKKSLAKEVEQIKERTNQNKVTDNTEAKKKIEEVNKLEQELEKINKSVEIKVDNTEAKKKIEEVNKLEQELEKLSKGLNTLVLDIGQIHPKLADEFNLAYLKDESVKLQSELKGLASNDSDIDAKVASINEKYNQLVSEYTNTKVKQFENAISAFNTDDEVSLKSETNHYFSSMSEELEEILKKAMPSEYAKYMEMKDIHELNTNAMRFHTRYETGRLNTDEELFKGNNLNTSLQEGFFNEIKEIEKYIDDSGLNKESDPELFQQLDKLKKLVDEKVNYKIYKELEEVKENIEMYGMSEIDHSYVKNNLLSVNDKIAEYTKRITDNKEIKSIEKELDKIAPKDEVGSRITDDLSEKNKDKVNELQYNLSKTIDEKLKKILNTDEYNNFKDLENDRDNLGFQHEILDRKRRLESRLHEDLTSNLIGYEKMFKGEQKVHDYFSSRQELFDYIANPYNRNDEKFIETIRELSPTPRIKDISNLIKAPRSNEDILKENNEEKNRIIKQYSDVIKQDYIDDLYSQSNEDKIIKQRAESVALVKKSVEDIKALKINKEDAILVDPSDNSIEVYEYKIITLIEKLNKLRESIVDTQNTLNSTSAQFVGIEPSSLNNAVSIVNSGLRANLKGDALDNYNLLEELVRTIIVEAGGLEFNNVSNEAIVSSQLLSLLKIKEDWVKGYSGNAGEYKDKKYIEYYNDKVGNLFYYKELNKVKSDEKYGLNISEIENIEKALEFLKNKIEQTDKNLNELAKGYEKAERSIPEITEIKPSMKGFGKLGKALSSIEDPQAKNDAKIITQALKLYDKANKNYDNYNKQEQARLKEQKKIEFNNVKNYVSNWEVVNGQKMPLQDQLEYYKSAIKQFEKDSDEYLSILRMQRSVEQQINAQAEADRQKALRDQEDQRKQRQSLADEMYKAKFNHVKNYVSDWEAENGKKMPLQDQLEYYKSAIKQFEQYSDEYYSVLRMQRSVEQQINEQAEAERQKALREQEAQKKQTLDNIQTITNAMKNLSSFISNMVNRVLSVIKMGVNAIKSLAHGAISVINLFKNSLQRILTLFGNFGNRVGLVNRNGNLLKGTFTELRSKVQLLTTAFNRLFNNQFIKNGQELLSSIQTLNIIIGSELTENTIGWANELERAFGLSASGIIADLKELTAVMYGMGMSGEHSISASKNLNVMANQLSTIIGYDTATVVNKIQSGMKGMTQSIDDLGLSVREAQMNQFLKDLKAQGGEFANISTSFANLTEQQRVYVRYAAIMSQFMSKYDTKTYVASLDTITGHIALLKNSLRSLASTVGTLFLQLFDKIVVPLIIMIRSVQSAVIKLAEWLNSIFNLGLKLDLSADMNGNSDSIKTTNDDLKDLGNTAEDTSKKMAGLDSFDHVSTMSSSDGGSGSDFDYSKLMDLFKDNDLASQMADLAKIQDDWLEKQKEKFKAWLHELKHTLQAWYKDVTGRHGFDFGFNFVVIYNALKRALKNIGNILIQLRDIIGGVGIMILEDLQIGKIITRMVILFADFTGLIRTALETLKPYIIDFYEKYLSPIFKNLGTVISDGIGKGITKLRELTEWFKDPENSGEIQEWFDNLGRIVEKAGIILNTLFTGKTSQEDLIKLGDNGDNNVVKINEGAIYDVNNIAKSIHGIVSSLIEILGQLFTDLSTYMKEEGFSKISEALDKVDKFLSTNKEAIVEVVESIARLAKTFIETMFNEFMELLQFLVDHKDTIINICETLENAIKWISDHANVFVMLAGIKIGASAFSGIFKLADSISDIYITMQAIKGLRAGGGILANLFGTGASTAAASGAESAVPLGAVAPAGIGASAMKLGAVGLIVGQVALTSKAVKKTVSEWPYLASQASTEAQTVFDLLNKKASLTGAQLRENAQTMLDGLIDIYGQEIPASGVEKMLESYKKRLEDAGIYTDEQINSWIGHAHRYIENFGTVVGSVDTSIYTSKLTQASSDISASAEEIAKSANAILNENAKIIQDMNTTNKGVSADAEELNNKLAESWNNIKINNEDVNKSFSSLRSSSTKEMSNTYGQLRTHVNGISGSFLGLKTSIANSINSITSKIAELTRIKMPSFSFSSLFKSNSNTYASVTSTKKIRGFANGGVPKSGSIFYANENGNLELAGNFGGYSGVANQDMIIQSMKQAIGETMHSAVTKAMKGNSRGNIQNTYEICKGGIFVGDNSSIRRLAELINNANISSTGNIANLGFSV